MKRLIILSCIGIVVLIALSFLAQKIGGISLNSVATSAHTAELTVSEPVLPGVPTKVHIASSAGAALPVTELVLQTKNGTSFLSSGMPEETSLPITLPCDTDAQAILILRVFGDKTILAQHRINVLPAGADCAWHVSQ